MVGFFTELSGPLEVGHLEGGLSLEATALTTGEGLVGPLEAKRRGRSFMLNTYLAKIGFRSYVESHVGSSIMVKNGPCCVLKK